MIGLFDPLYWTLIGPGLLLALYASIKVKSAFARASQIGTQKGWTGREVAEALLRNEGIYNVAVEPVNSYLGDHYDPYHKVLRLSPDVYNGRSVAAAGVAAHEAGHALQDAQGYRALSLRNSIVPVANFGSSFSFIVLIIGLSLAMKTLVILGCALFTMVVLFQLINLPVEFNASKRAKQALVANGMVTEAEEREVSRVLNAAAMTYVAATLTAILTLVYYLMKAGLLGGRRDD
jgi:uncharacterized protein